MTAPSRDTKAKLGAVTIKDVAREANVSVASVSRVVNGHHNVQAQTRARVLEVIDRLRYTPHVGARDLITRRTRVIGVLLPDLYGEFFSELIRGIDGAARERKLQLLLSSSHGDAAEMVAAVQTMRGRVDGLLMMAPHLDAAGLGGRLPEALPLVFMNSRVEPGVPSVAIDSYAGARAMVRHLVTCGHRTIAHLAGPADNFDAHERLRGYHEELAASLPGVAPQVLLGDFSEASGYRAGRALVDAAARPAALFAANDMMALGALSALLEAGLEVPRDLALAGFDDIPLAAYVRPALTTVRARIAELGKHAVHLLAATIDRDAGALSSPSLTLQPEPVVRQSCGAPSRMAQERQPGARTKGPGGPEPQRGQRGQRGP